MTVDIPSPVTRSPNQILIADHDPASRAKLRGLLENAHVGHVVEATSASEIYARLLVGNQDEPTDVSLILLDIDIPGEDGIAVCAYLKMQPRFEDVPVIIMSSVGDPERLQLGFVAGAMDHVLKPVDDIELLMRVRSALRTRLVLAQSRLFLPALLRLSEEVKELRESAARAGEFDATGMADQAMLIHYARQWATGAGNACPASLILATIDAAEQFERHHSTSVVARTLDAIAGAVLRSTARIGDLAGRWDRMTFAVFLPDSSMEQARQVAMTISENVSALKIPHGYSIRRAEVMLDVGIGHTQTLATKDVVALTVTAQDALDRAVTEDATDGLAVREAK